MSALGKTEWAHALAGGLSVCGAKGFWGHRPNVHEAGISRLRTK